MLLRAFRVSSTRRSTAALIKARLVAPITSKIHGHCTRNSSSTAIDISQDIIDKYNDDGVVCLRDVFHQKWIDKVRIGIKETKSNPGKMAKFITDQQENLKNGGQVARSPAYFLDYDNWKRISEFEEFVLRSPAAEITGKLMGSKHSIFYYDNIFTKDPCTSRSTPWHQDQTYYPLEGHQTCSIWMPVTPVSKKNCVKFIKGSHKWGNRYWPKQFMDSKDYSKNDNQLSKKYVLVPDDMDENTEKYQMLTWSLRPGDCLAFHMKSVHGFPSLLDTEGREVLSTRWVGEKVVFGERPWDVDETLMKGGLKTGDCLNLSPDEYPVVWRS